MDRDLERLLRAASLCIAVTVAIAFMVFIGIWHSDSFGMDFGVYWRVANAPASLAYEHRATLNFPYPPTMLLWISPLALISKWPAYWLWIAFSLGTIVASCHRYLDKTALPLALIAPPVFYCLLTGQVSIALGALVLWSCSTNNRIAAGIGLGVVASIKPQLVLLAPLLLAVNRDRSAIISAGLTLGGLALLSVAVFGFDSWAKWIGILDHFQSVVVKNGVLSVMITPASAAELWHLPTIPFLLLGLALGAAVVLYCRNAEPLTRSAAIVTGSLLAAPYAVMYDLAALAPFLAWAIARGRIVGVIAYSGGLNIIPLLVTAFELVQAVPVRIASLHQKGASPSRESSILD